MNPRIPVMVMAAACTAFSSFGAQVFDQNFSSSTSVASYVNATAPGTGQFNNISAEANGGTWSINSGRLQLQRTGLSSANGAGFSRTTAFPGSPSVLAVKFTFGVTADIWRSEAMTIDIGNITGSGAYNYQSYTPGADTFATLFVDLRGSSTFRFKAMTGGGVQSSDFAADGTQYSVSYYLNKTGTAQTYLAPGGVIKTLGANAIDLWVGTSLQFDNIAAINGASSTLNNLRVRMASSDNGIWRMDNINVDNALPAVPPPVSGGLAILPAPSAFNLVSGSAGSGSLVTVAVPEFTQAWRVTVNPATSYADTNVILSAPTTLAVAKGEALLATFYYRRSDDSASEADITACFKAIGSTGGKSITLPLRGRQQWRKMSIPFVSADDYLAGAAALEFQLGAQEQQIEIGGVSVTKYGQRSLLTSLPNATPTDATPAFTFQGTAYADLTMTNPVYGNPLFSNAYRVAVKNVAVPAPTSVRFIKSVPVAVSQGDVLVAIFWMRGVSSTETALPLGGVTVGLNASPYTALLGQDTLYLDNEWRQHIIPVVMTQNYAAQALQFSVKFGAKKNQVIEVAGLQLLNFGNLVNAADLNSTQYDYPGRSMKAAWRAEAETRIEQNRKGNLTVNVKSASGTALSGVNVIASLQKHRFGFGSAVGAERLLATGADADQYRTAVEVFFNKVVMENDMKWEYLAANGNQDALGNLAWLRPHGVFGVRGHTLVWPDTTRCPGTAGLTGSAAEAVIEAHIENPTTGIAAYPGVKSFLTDWDVVNEPYLKYTVMNAVSGGTTGRPLVDLSGIPADATASALWLESAKRADPAALRVINDVGPATNATLAFPTVDDYSLALTDQLLGTGAPLQALGFQSHLGERVLPPVVAEALFNRYNQNLTLQITEYDHDTQDRVMQADYLSDYMTLAFSLERFDTFLLWGFWDGLHWHKNAPLFDTNWNLKMSGEAWMALVHDKWTTDETKTSDDTGLATIRGFLGRYALEATQAGITTTYYTTLPTKAGAALDMKLSASAGTKVWLHEAEEGVRYDAMTLHRSTDIPVDASAAAASGGAYVVGEVTNNVQPAASETAHLRIDTEASDSVYIWLRVLAPDGARNSFWMKTDNVGWTAITVAINSNWKWVRCTGLSATANLTVLPSTAGNSIYFSTREAGCKLDKVLITTDPNFTP